MVTEIQPPAEGGASSSNDNDTVKVIQTRFGPIHIHMDKMIYFPSGLLGMSEYQHFCLAPFPKEQLSQFSMLQSTQDTSLTFMTLPLPRATSDDVPVIHQDDLDNVKQEFGLTDDTMLIVLIATLHQDDHQEGVHVSVNLRAPLVINTEERIGVQYVFEKSDYPVRHRL